MSRAILFALLSLFFAGLLDVVYKRYSRKERSRGTYVFGIGVVWCMLQTAALAMGEEVLIVDATSIRYGLFAGLCLTLSNLLLLESLTHINISLGSTVYRLNTIGVVVMAFLFLGEALGGIKLLGVGLGIVAVGLLYRPDPTAMSEENRGRFLPFFLMAVAASLLRAGYGVITRGGIVHQADPQTMLLLCALSWIVGGAFYARLREGRLRLTKKKVGYALVSGVLVFLVVDFLMLAVKYGEASIVIPIANMSFVMAMLLSVVLRFEPFSLRKGIAMVVACLAIATLTVAAG
ncbi:MAG: EamA family transporter [Deltaproteobacteria bacterium]|nr:EamA family transporter [Deltaproteobacteria bacterium]MDH4007258.1 DMT family transporter [Desulfuromonadales bacterium]